MLLCAGSACAGEGEHESPGLILTVDGSLIKGMVKQVGAWSISTPSSSQPLESAKIESITIGERVDPNVENEALVAVGDLQSDKFDVREKAAAKLRGLGRSAAKPLKQALASNDAEVVRQAKALLVEVGGVDDSGQTQDRVKLRDGTTLQGELNFTDVYVRSAWGRFRFPVEALEKIVFLDAEIEAKAPGNSALKFVGEDAKEIVVAPPAAGRVDAAAAQRWNPNEEDSMALEGWLGEAQRNALTMDKIPDPKAPAGAPKPLVAAKAGDRLENAYAEWGVLVRATEANAAVAVSEEKLRSFSGGLSLAAKKSDLEVRFVAPKSDAALIEESAGVLYAGAMVRTAGPGTVGLAAYDAAGRLLVQVVNLAAAANVPPGMPRDEFLGVRSKTPIARLRFFRLGTLKEQNADFLLDDLIHDRVTLVGLRPEFCRISLLSGERLAGKAADADTDVVGLRTEFLGEKAEPLKFKLDAIKRYEPPRTIERKDDTAKNGAEENDKPKRRRFGAPHGILLQSGESFRARLLSIDEKWAVFGLAGGAMVKLPRETLRKIELITPHTEAGEAPPPIAVAADEKPGVEFKTKPVGNNPAAPQNPPEKKDPDRNPAQGLPRMDDAEVVSLDPETRELTVKDENGEMTLSLAGVKSLVFPANPNAGTVAKKRGWRLTLREGSGFDAEILRITPTDITAEMAGGLVVMEAESVEAVERR